MITREDWLKLAEEVGEIVAKKNAAYGDSVRRAAIIMQTLYPQGILFDQIPSALLIVRMLDKMSRIANDPTFGGEDPPCDLGGYSLLMMELQRNGLYPKKLEDPR